MSQNDDQRITASLAKIMAMICVRNSRLEDLHAGQVSVTYTGDYSDVFVVDADGQRIPWPDVSRIDDDEMRALMRDIVNRLYTFHLCADEAGLQAEVTRWMTVASRWDEPTIDPRMLEHAVFDRNRDSETVRDLIQALGWAKEAGLDAPLLRGPA